MGVGRRLNRLSTATATGRSSPTITPYRAETDRGQWPHYFIGGSGREPAGPRTRVRARRERIRFAPENPSTRTRAGICLHSNPLRRGETENLFSDLTGPSSALMRMVVFSG